MVISDDCSSSIAHCDDYSSSMVYNDDCSSLLVLWDDYRSSFLKKIIQCSTQKI